MELTSWETKVKGWELRFEASETRKLRKGSDKLKVNIHKKLNISLEILYLCRYLVYSRSHFRGSERRINLDDFSVIISPSRVYRRRYALIKIEKKKNIFRKNLWNPWKRSARNKIESRYCLETANTNIATFFAHLADWTRKRNSVCCATYLRSPGGPARRGERGRERDRFAGDDNDAEVSFAKSCSGIRARSYFILRIPGLRNLTHKPSVG